MSDIEIKNQVRNFYNQVGWSKETDGLYQNARYEDLRPVSSEYIHKCHLRVNRHIKSKGFLFLDAGSGPVQYPEYLTYSKGYQYRVCMDLSFVALKEAKIRLKDKGLYVVADVAKLPFVKEVFDGIVSLHTIHHIPSEEKKAVYQGLFDRLKEGCSMVTVDGWTHVPLKRLMDIFAGISKRLLKLRTRNKKATDLLEIDPQYVDASDSTLDKDTAIAGTYVLKTDWRWFKNEMQEILPFTIRVWRSVSVRFLREAIHPELSGKFLLKLLFFLEELFPVFFGKRGQYPLIIFKKKAR